MVNKEVVEFLNVVFLVVKFYLIVLVIKEVIFFIDFFKYFVVFVVVVIITEVIEVVSNSYVMVLFCYDKFFDRLVNI